MPDEQDEMVEIVNDFITETEELIEALDNDLIELEKSPDDRELINKIFRSVHTIKGAAGFLGFNQLVDIVHHSESVLNKCRQGELLVTPRINDVILKAVDLLRHIITRIRNRESSDDIDIQPIIKELKECLGQPERRARLEDRVVTQEKEPQPEDQAEKAEPSSAPTDEDTREVTKLGELLINEEFITEEQLTDALEDQGKKPRLGEILVERQAISRDDLEKALEKQAKKPSSAREQTIRVPISRLDDVMNLVGELVLGRNRIMQIGSELEMAYENDPRVHALMDTMTNINMVTSDLQAGVMRTRMQPIKKIFNRFPRMVRDLARSLDKEVSLEIKGEDTELDKSVIEEIGDPLVHIIRNSVDHGLETPDEREAKGKPAQGTIKLSAFYEGNSIVIETSDDGKGIDPEKIAQAALSKGIIQTSDLEHMTEKDKLNLIFAPGFSTAENLSNISGRGVGMDVVRSNVIKLNGTVNVATEVDKGTTITIRLPLTVAIIQTLMVGVGNEIFALPLVSVVETIRTSAESIQYIDQQEVIRLRDEVLPLVRMEYLFDVDTSSTAEKKMENRWIYVVVIGIAEKKIGLVVGKLFGQEEVVIKSLGKYIQPKGIAGASILGNGKITLIVDLGGLMEVIEEMGPLSKNPAHRVKEIEPVKSSSDVILTIDDSPIARESLKRSLESAGYQVIEAVNGLEGLEKLAKHPEINLVITDILMPKMNGYELTKKIKSDKRFKSLPVIALTVMENEEDREEGVRVGIDGYFYKSDLTGMINSVRKFIN